MQQESIYSSTHKNLFMYEVVIGRTEEERRKYGTKGAIFLGKHFVQMGQTVSLANEIFLDVLRSHVLLICGKRGSGKCLHSDTLITLDDGSQVPIKHLEHNENNIYTLNEQLKIQQGKKAQFYKRITNRILKITFRSSKTIQLTPEHPLLTVKGWIPAEKLTLGSRIATPRKLDAFGEKPINEERVKLLAYLIAEGHLGNRFVLFSNADAKIIEDFKTAITCFDRNLRVENHSHPYCFRVAQIKKKMEAQSTRNEKGQFSSGPKFARSTIREWLESVGLYGKLSKEKVLPKEIFNLPKHQLSLFLNRLFSCDGSIYQKHGAWFTSYCSSSDQLIKQVQHLLLRFGILSRVRRKNIQNKFTANELEINGEFVSIYLQEIGFYGRKEERAKIALEESVKIVRNPNVDTIPREIWDLYKPENWAAVGRKIGYAHPKALRESMRYSPSRQKLLQIAKADESVLIEKFATSDIFWDEVVSLQYLEGCFEVYDLTVPETHNFVANDIIVHNSYSMGVIAEGISDLPPEVKENISIILLDTMGVYWTMKYANRKERENLMKWNMDPKTLDVQIYTPVKYYQEYKDKGIPADFPFSIRPADLTAQDWCITFEIELTSAFGVVIERVLTQLREKLTEQQEKETLKTQEEPQLEYDIDEIIAAIKQDQYTDETTKAAIVNRFLNTQQWGIFSKKGTPLSELARAGKVTILDVSCYATLANGWKIKSLVIGLIAQKLFNERMLQRKYEEYKQVKESVDLFSSEKEKKGMPLVWLVLDEAHEFLPEKGKTTAMQPLITILREGRQPGISLILATQQPGKIHTDVLTQADMVLSHRLTAKIDTDALGKIMQSYMREGLPEQIDKLPRTTGAALIFDDANEKLYSIQVRPRFTWHGGESPIALNETSKKFSF